MKNKIEKLLNGEYTLAAFLKESKGDLELVSMTFDTNEDSLDVKFGSDKESTKITKCGFPKTTNGQDLTNVLVDLKKDWKSLLTNDKYRKDIDAFLAKYKLNKITINFQNEEVKFFSGNHHLVEGLDLYNQ